tara:strand:+ start:575 stop:817 length:243 start_codon:yes stop_codon:yes gene_type:complete
VAKQICGKQQVVMVSVEPEKIAKAGQPVHIGERFRIELENRQIQIEVLEIPVRIPSKKERQRFFRLLDEQQIDPYSDLSF